MGEVSSEQTSIQSLSPTPTRSAPQIAEAFLPRTLAAADTGDKPTRLSATPARVRAQ